MAKILIVEDDKRTNMAICEYLKRKRKILLRCP